MESSNRASMQQLLRGRAKSALAIVGAWTVFGILATAHFFLADASDEASTFLEYAEHIVVFYWGWALLTPVVAWFAHQSAEPAFRRRYVRRWAPVAIGIVVVTLTHGVIYLLAMRAFGTHPDLSLTTASLRDHLVRHGGGDIATYLLLTGGFLYRDAVRRNHAHEVANAALETRLARSDMELLRWRLQPHFLFNALNALSTLVLKGDMDGADRAIALIAKFLRATLRQTADALVPLSEEVQMAERYVAIEALRFGQGVRLECDVDPAIVDNLVPSMILQPVVENAIRYGIGAPGERDATGATSTYVVSLTAQKTANRLIITVRDPALAAEGAGTGFGLRYVRERLEHHYGGQARFQLEKRSRETVATFDLPLLAAANSGMRTAS